MRNVLLIVTFLLVASIVYATCPAGFDCNQEYRKRGFLSTENVALTAGVVLTAVTDVESTFACLNTTAFDTRTGLQWRCVESNRFSRPFVNRGKGAAYGSKVVIVATATVPSYYLRRSRHKILRVAGYVLPVATILVQGRATAINMRNRSFIKSHQ